MRRRGDRRRRVEAAEPLLDGRAVEIDVPDDLPLVRADAVLCERILVNLLHNAARQGPRRSGSRGGSPASASELAVSDAGPGLDGSIAGRALEPFVAGPRTGGTGIGLALEPGLARARAASCAWSSSTRTHARLELPLAPVSQVTA